MAAIFENLDRNSAFWKHFSKGEDGICCEHCDYVLPSESDMGIIMDHLKSCRNDQYASTLETEYRRKLTEVHQWFKEQRCTQLPQRTKFELDITELKQWYWSELRQKLLPENKGRAEISLRSKLQEDS